MTKLTDRDLFDKAWAEKRDALGAQTTPSFRRKYPATAANAARLLAVMQDMADRVFQSVRSTDAFQKALADYEVSLVESAAVMRVLGLVEQYVIPLALSM
jgi:predicted N-acyltransferase